MDEEQIQNQPVQEVLNNNQQIEQPGVQNEIPQQEIQQEQQPQLQQTQLQQPQQQPVAQGSMMAQSSSTIDIEQDSAEPQKQQAEMHITIALGEFRDAIKSFNFQKVKDMIAQYKEKHDIANKIEPRTKQISTFQAVQVGTDEQSSQMLKILVEEGGADKHYQDNLKQNIMFYICKEGKVETLKYAISQNISFSEIDFLEQIPLFYACREGRLEILKVLNEHKCNLNHQDKLKQTCLFYAAREGQAEICRFLFQNGINYAHQDTKKQSAFNWAKKYVRKNVIELFQEYGVGPKQKQKQHQQQQQQVLQQPSATPNMQANQENQLPSINQQESSSKRKRDKEEQKNTYKLVYTDEKGQQKELTNEDFEQFKKDYPDIAEIIMNPDEKITQEMIEQFQESESKNWKVIAKKLVNILWKQKGAYIFHFPVDVQKLQCYDYFDHIKVPMDFTTIKTKLNNNVYSQCKEFVADCMLVFTNCVTYNGEQSEIGKIGLNFLKQFELQSEQCGLNKFLEQDNKIEQI